MDPHLRRERSRIVLALLLTIGAGCAVAGRDLARNLALARAIAVTFGEPGVTVTGGGNVLRVGFPRSPRATLPDSERTEFARRVAMYVAAHRGDAVASISVEFGAAAGPAYTWPVSALTGENASFYPLAFACPHGDTIRVRFESDSAHVVLPHDRGPRTLPHVISGSGARYSDGSVTFWNKGDSAFVMRGDSVVINRCAVVADSGA